MTEFSDASTNPAYEPGRESTEMPPPGGRREQLVERFQQGAEYLRNLRPEDLQQELEAGIRARPILSVVLAACAGFLIGRLLRD